MRIHELKKPEGSTKAPKRIGRGQGTGQENMLKLTYRISTDSRTTL